MVGKTYIVPSVMPCGESDLCKRGRGNVCRAQKMPGNDFHGGYASHFVAPGRFLCPVPRGTRDVEDLSIVADAVSTAYQAVTRAGADYGSMVVVVGAGGVGTFAAQSAKARGAHVAANDVDPVRLTTRGPHQDPDEGRIRTDDVFIRNGIPEWDGGCTASPLTATASLDKFIAVSSLP